MTTHGDLRVAQRGQRGHDGGPRARSPVELAMSRSSMAVQCRGCRSEKRIGRSFLSEFDDDGDERRPPQSLQSLVHLQ